jgi:hypothetical protein
MKVFKSAQQNVKKIFRPAGSGDQQLEHQADCSLTPTHAATSDNTTSGSKSGTSTTVIGNKAGIPDIKDDKKPVPTITVEECAKSLAPISPPYKRFVEVKTANAQHDLVVLHVAYILQKSSNLKSLILEIVKLSKMHGVREFSCCSSRKLD